MGSSKAPREEEEEVVEDVSVSPTRSSSHDVSPSAIPPRTSSTGLHFQAQRQSFGFSPITISAVSAVLSPVSEAAWLVSSDNKGKQPEEKKQQQTDTIPTTTTTTTPVSMQQQHHHHHHHHQDSSPDPQRYALESFTARGTWSADKERIVRGPFEYVVSHPGKDFRAQLIAAFNAWLDVPAASLDIITKVVGMLHESSLLVDDVQDSSELRRGFPVAHRIFGVPQTINSANYIYFAALQELLTLGNQRVIATFADELVNLHRGQGMDLFWRDTLTCPTEEDYLEMVANKTGGLFRLGIKLMQAESAAAVDCVPLIDIIGLIFQIRDDYMNLSSNEYSHNKGMCEDLTEGKFSFPVIHSIRADPTDLQLISILKQKTTDVQVKRYAVSFMESKGSFEYTRQVVATLIERARKMVDELDAGAGKAGGIQKILDKMVIVS